MQRAPVQRSSSPSLLEERNQQLETNLRFVVQQLSQRAEDAVMERLDALLARKERDLRHALLRAQARDLSPTERLEERVGVLERTFAAAVALLGQADDAPAQAAAAPASSAASPFSPHPWDSRGAPYASPAPPPQTPPPAAARSSSREAELAKQVEVLTAETGHLKAEVAEATAAADKARAEAARRVHAAEEEASISKAAAAAAAARSRDLEEAVEAAREAERYAGLQAKMEAARAEESAAEAAALQTRLKLSEAAAARDAVWRAARAPRCAVAAELEAALEELRAESEARRREEARAREDTYTRSAVFDEARYDRAACALVRTRRALLGGVRASVRAQLETAEAGRKWCVDAAASRACDDALRADAKPLDSPPEAPLESPPPSEAVEPPEEAPSEGLPAPPPEAPPEALSQALTAPPLDVPSDATEAPEAGGDAFAHEAVDGLPGDEDGPDGSVKQWMPSAPPPEHNSGLAQLPPLE
ncbi:hypothetical protein EMIHUDRAFT_447873 [Emiliania huxleyi CCMP1516]|uniref:Uncharacterized protein n=2 Tax=Emiliania huxleyi TaxID=2903 RepID=A0A0D3JI77_EMIH1|nr:hypothetical protein EMIHUDRAFT_447873 [Emiliania huxleyi CCMP1516]EOD23212.1 hypothetical protein EMIHUDRAFT_447873 [Emiliania huxleyi CCMP1516]|eukprot:XP_005775641.1 hypothetical protein EMIHUDRAFT_447873 [Emiliania huxleyi CCMP1516]